MNNLENNIKDCIAKELEKGIIEKAISEQLESCIKESIEAMFKWNGCVKKTIEEKIKSTIVPYLESYDYSEYITKLDSVLVYILKNTALPNKEILENFKELMVNEEIEEIKITDIFKKWNEYCRANIDRDKLDMDYEGGYISTSFNVEEVSNGWSIYKTYMVTFECEEDEKLRFEFSIQSRKPDNNREYTSNYDKPCDLKTLKYMNDFEIFMIRVSEGYKNIVIDSFGDSREIFIEYEE